MSRSMNESPKLLRVLGPAGATAVVVGAVIGSGVFFKANIIAKSVGRMDLVVLVWIVCGLVSFCGALALAELAAAIPHAGGQYVYLRRAYGPLSGFLWGWTEFWVLRTGSIAALAVIFATAFRQSLGDWLADPVDASTAATANSTVTLLGMAIPSIWLDRSIAITAILALTIVNVVGAHWGSWVQNVTTLLKGGTLVTLMVLPFLSNSSQPSLWTSTLDEPPALGLVAGFVAAMTAAFWAYDGWNNISLVAEEVHEPQRNLPLALGLGMLILVALYLGASLAYHLVLSMQEIASSSFVAASACEKMLGRHGGAIASAAVMISTFGALNANLLCGPRVLFAMARDRLFLPSMGQVHANFRTPHMAIIAEAGWAIVLVAASDLSRLVTVPSWVDQLPPAIAGPLRLSLEQMSQKATFDVLTDYVIFGSFLFYVLSVAAVFVLRWREPELERPYRTWGYPLLPLAFVVVSTGFLALMLVTSPVESLAGLAFLGIGAVAYAFRPR
jgi:APA family basic amino acid/polyamine antiporter